MGVVPWLPHLKTNAAGCESFPWGSSAVGLGFGPERSSFGMQLSNTLSWWFTLTWKWVDQINHGDLRMIRIWYLLAGGFFFQVFKFFDILFPSVFIIFLSNHPQRLAVSGITSGETFNAFASWQRTPRVGKFRGNTTLAVRLMTYRVSSYFGMGYIASLWRESIV